MAAPRPTAARAVTWPSPVEVALVALGGAVGSIARYGVGSALSRWGAGSASTWPVATATVNVVGAFLLGVLLEALARRGAETPGRRRARLGLGTGLLGGFTTYSALALEVDRMIGTGRAADAALYAVGSLVAGAAACLAGVAVTAAGHRWRRPLLPTDPDAVAVDEPDGSAPS